MKHSNNRPSAITHHTQLAGACSDSPFPAHDPHHRCSLLHPGCPPLPLGDWGHSGRLHQARPFWRQYNNPQHLRRVSHLSIFLGSAGLIQLQIGLSLFSENWKVLQVCLLHFNLFQLGVGAVCFHSWRPLLLCLHWRRHCQCYQDALEALAVKLLVAVTCFEHWYMWRKKSNVIDILEDGLWW